MESQVNYREVLISLIVKIISKRERGRKIILCLGHGRQVKYLRNKNKNLKRSFCRQDDK